MKDKIHIALCKQKLAKLKTAMFKAKLGSVSHTIAVVSYDLAFTELRTYEMVKRTYQTQQEA
jgi:hypothetical protein